MDTRRKRLVSNRSTWLRSTNLIVCRVRKPPNFDLEIETSTHSLTGASKHVCAGGCSPTAPPCSLLHSYQMLFFLVLLLSLYIVDSCILGYQCHPLLH